MVGVVVRVAHRAAVEHHRMVEQGAVALGGGLELLDEFREQGNVMGVHLREVHRLLGVFAAAIRLVRQRVVRVGDANVRERAAADVAHHHEGEDTGRVDLERRREQIEHDGDVFVVRLGRPDRGRQRDGIAVRPLLSALDAALDLPDVVEIVAETRLIALAESGL